MKFRYVLPVFVATYLGLSTVPSASAQSLNRKVADFCHANLNKTVGDGECAALGTEALRHAGARTSVRARRGMPALVERRGENDQAKHHHQQRKTIEDLAQRLCDTVVSEEPDIEHAETFNELALKFLARVP